MTKKKKRLIQPKPFLDALFDADEGLEIAVKSRQLMFRKGEVVMLRTTFTATNRGAYRGDLHIDTPLVERQSRIIKPGDLQ